MPTNHTGSHHWLDHRPVQQKVFLAFSLLLLLVFANGASYLTVQTKQKQSRVWTLHTYEVLEKLDLLIISVLNQQTGLRGFLITRKDDFLAPYHKGAEEVDGLMHQLRKLTHDNPAQQARLDRAEEILERWQTEVAKPELSLTRSARPDVELLEALVTKDRHYLDQTRHVLEQMQSEEQTLLDTRLASLERIVHFAFLLTIGSVFLGIFLVLFSMRLIQGQVTRPLIDLTGLMTRLSDDDHNIDIKGSARRDEIGALARALTVFKAMVVDIQQRNWVKTHAGEIAAALQATETRKDFGNVLSSSLSPLLNAPVSVFYIADEGSEYIEYCGSYGYRQASKGLSRYRVGEGLTGQCAKDRKSITVSDLPDDYVHVHSALGQAAPKTITMVPLQTSERLLGVLEFGSFTPFTPAHEALLNELLPIAALSLENLQRALRTKNLLEESQTLTEELQASSEELRVQQDELRATNEALQEQAQQIKQQSARLRASEEELRVQSEELQVSNEELRQKSSILATQKVALEQLQQETQQKADALERASQYKSEFLANMSHELRTPLNSLLILSRGLADNEEGHLSQDEVESATVIYESGSNLLRLINDILDLSKVESGKMELVIEPMNLAAFAGSLNRNFRHVAKERGLDFSVDIDPAVPPTLETDSAKLEQVIGNLLSNAFKFTRQGSVRVLIEPVAGRDDLLGISVIDTGIGIPKDKFDKIFQAFEQVDGSTSRHFGGTGLGLSISRGMAQLLGGEIRVESTEGEGTRFHLLLPRTQVAGVPSPAAMSRSELPKLASTTPSVTPVAQPTAALTLPDDRELLQAKDTIILVVEDDAAFARILLDLVRRKGYRALFAGDGETGLALAREFRPTGILLDVMLPGMDGFTVIEKLKQDADTRHIPVHFISATEDHTRGLDLGAVGFLTKPVTREALGSAFNRLLHFSADSLRHVLVVDDDAASRLAVKKLIAADNIRVAEANGGADALAQLEQVQFDCVILDLGMADVNGFEFLERAATLPAMPPVVIYSGRELSREENLKLREYTDSIVIKGARSPERLLDEVSLFLHSIHAPSTVRPREVDTSLHGRTVLVVDDDMRNIFALSKTLRAKGVKVVMAQDGLKAIKQLGEQDDIEMVLMDIMMPGMDGYQTMGEIRKNPKYHKLPIIALTAKAMRGDREKCLEAGANDYLSKPIDLDKLFSLMRVWLPKP